MDNDLHYTARFRRSIQPAQYETAEAEVSVSGRVADGDVASAAAAMLDKAAGVVLARLTQVKVGTNAPTASLTGGSAPIEPEKRGPGRPPKPKTLLGQVSEALTEVAEKFEKEAPKEEPNAAKLAGADADPTPEVKEKDLPAVADAELQAACSKAAKVITSQGVKDLYMKNYRVQRVTALDRDMRRPFLKDLDALVKKAQADKKPDNVDIEE